MSDEAALTRLLPRSFVTSEDGGSGSRYPHQGDLDDPIRFVKVQPQTWAVWLC